MKEKRKTLSSSELMTTMIIVIVSISLAAGAGVFLTIYRSTMTQSAKIATEQAVVQVSNMVGNYTEDMNHIMSLVETYYSQEARKRDEDMNALAKVRAEVVVVTGYDMESGRMVGSWAGSRQIKKESLKNLSYPEHKIAKRGGIVISSPHVESLLVNEYPWVVSIQKVMTDAKGRENLVVVDVRFSQIAHYVDDVGIGRHGYCFILDQEGNIIYHPQQQLIFSGLKGEEIGSLARREDSSFIDKGVIYTINTREDTGWRIVGISYVDEMVTERIRGMLVILVALLLTVLLTAFLCSVVLSRKINRPIQQLMDAMGDFEKNAADFAYQPVQGSREIMSLSDSFSHMVVRIQELMTQVRNEEISLRKTELRALQAQINPHFLYNTLDSIGWMCEEGRNQEAVEMVNALARLFRISISKGHELIPIAKEVEHAKSYLQIQNFRYKNQFTYSFEVDENCLSYYCNKITLQPIIENAIYHGLNRMVEVGRITIKIREQEDMVVFTVTDNGVGMSPEQCRGILHREPGDQTGIGIKNVNDRIQIYFGERYGLHIESELDVGTKVVITMPKVKEDTYEPR